MAISKNVEHKGLSIKDAYHKVAPIELTKTGMIFSVEICASKGNDGLYFRPYSCAYDINGADPFEQAYGYLKSLVEYEGAADC